MYCANSFRVACIAGCICLAMFPNRSSHATVIYYTQPITGTVMRTDGTTTTTFASGLNGDTGVVLNDLAQVRAVVTAGFTVSY